MQHLHDRDARVEPDQVGERERPHRMREAELRDRVDRLRLGDAFQQRVRGLVDERHQDAVRDEAREVVRLGRLLAEIARRAATIAAAVSSDVCTARITSTSFSTGTGLKKCMPITRSGRRGRRGERRDRDRRRVRGEDRARRQRPSSARRKTSSFDGGVLDDRLDHRGRPATSSSDGGDAREHLVGIRRRPSRRASSRLLRIAASPRSIAPGYGVVERDARGRRRRRPARCRRPSGPRRQRERARSPSRERLTSAAW